MEGENKYNLEQAQEEAEILQKKVESGETLSYGEAEKKLGLEPIEGLLNKKITEFEPIDVSLNTTVRERADLARLVERPLLSACEELYDKNIITLGTSANKKDFEYTDWENPGQFKPAEAYIIIDFDTLSAKNKEIGESLGGVTRTEEGDQLKITIPLTKESTFEDVHTQAQEIAHKFIKQAYRVVTFTWEDIRRFYGYEPNDESVKPEDFGDFYYWDPQRKLFFLSKEQYQKAIEQVDEDEEEEDDV